MSVDLPTLNDLVAAGAHYGHTRGRTYPKAKKFTYTVKNNVFVIDLEKTQKQLAQAVDFVTKIAQEGKVLLFVGTKSQAQAAIRQAAELVNMPYVDFRWLGGTLTNFETILKNLNKLQNLSEMVDSDLFKEYSKKEQGRLTKKLAKLKKIFAGIKDLKKIPDALIVVDVVNEDVAVKEAQAMNIPIVGIIDVDANPDLIDYPIPANDDSKKTIALILNVLAEAIAEGQKNIKIVQEKSETSQVNKETPATE